MTAFKVTSGTSIFGAGVGFSQDSAAADSLTVDIDAFVISTANDAVVLANTGAWTATINGTVYSKVDAGLELAQGNLGMSKINIGVAGLIAGDVGLVLRSNATVVNKGTIEGVDRGVGIVDANCTFTNYGYVDDGFLLDSVGVHTVKITNTSTGYIDESIEAVSDHVVTIINSGIIEHIDLSDSGTNTISNSNLIRGLVLGDGKNVLTNSGTIDYWTIFGDGIDIVTNSGTLGDSSVTIDLKGGNDIFKNTSLEKIIVDMGAGDDQYTGGNAEELFLDASGSDKVSLGGSDDEYRVFAVVDDGTDTIDAGAGVDTYDASEAGVGVNINLDSVAHNFAPFDPMLVLAANSAQQGTVKDIIRNFEKVDGSGFNDNIAGSAAVNRLLGLDGDDTIFGYAGNDILFGSSGSDRLVGGAGKDALDGGSGGDVFFFEKTSDSTVTARDFITSFDDGFDVIELSAIDANTKNGSATNDAFVYIGANANFAGVAGQLRSYWTNDGWIFEGDVNGDKRADFAFEVQGDANHAIVWDADLHL